MCRSRGALLVALLALCCAARCRAAILSSHAARSVVPQNGTTPVSLNTVLLSVARSPQLPDDPANSTTAAQDPEPKFGPYGQILGQLETRGPFSRKGTMIVDTEPLTPQDFERAERLRDELPPDGVNDPIIQEAYFQGDIVMPVNDFVALNEDNAIVQTELWPGGLIYYTMSSQFTSREKAVIAGAVQEFEKHTCLKVIPLTPGFTSRDHVHVTKGAGCFSSVGRKGGRQQLSLGKGCVYKGIVMHEFMHASGFWHEQSRPDRDDHVTVHFSNIKPLMRFNFKKYEWGKVPNLGVGYDVGSIMHYGPHAFATDRSRPTLTARRSTGVTMGQRKGFSLLDVKKLNRLYKCTSTTPTMPAPPTGGSTSCKDTNQSCGYWAKRGECSRNKKYMHKNCMLSCRKCTDGCKDMDRSCSGWAQRGECSKNPSYMHQFCRPSCGLCTPTSPLCTDKEALCAYWARNNECRNNPGYMHVQCKLSCNKC